MIIVFLVGGFNPSEKYARQIGNLPQRGVKIENVWNHHLDYLLKTGIIVLSQRSY